MVEPTGLPAACDTVMERIKLPMACGCGPEGQAKVNALIATATEALNASGDWLTVDVADVDLLMTAVCSDGWGVTIYGDQWFGMSARSHDDKVVIAVESDTIIAGLAAIYLHLSARHAS